VSQAAPRVLHLVSGELADVPVGDDWLSTAERTVLAGLRLEKRRADWRLGRWLVRCAVRAAVPAAADFEILAGADGAPEVHGLGRPPAVSISHRHGHGLAVAATGDASVGCDLELVEPRTVRFITDWLTDTESARVLAAPEAARPLLANLAWSAKESASKVLRVGLRFDTRAFEVALPGADALDERAGAAWQLLSVTATKLDRTFVGAWRLRRGFIESVLAEEPVVIRAADA
jgi:4'-phosphopantetheinyl transferase